MQEIATPKKPKSLWKVKALAAIVPASGLVMAASAATIDLNGTVGPILDSVIELIPSIIGLIVAIVPAIITLAVVGFILAFFDRILGMMKI
jgi:hypothetical protein